MRAGVIILCAPEEIIGVNGWKELLFLINQSQLIHCVTVKLTAREPWELQAAAGHWQCQQMPGTLMLGNSYFE